MTSTRADSLAAEYDVASYADLSGMLSEVDPDVVSVATLEKHHVDPTVTALESGADVRCEKIMAASVADGCQMVAAAEETGRTLAVDYNYRHMPSFARIARAIESG